VARTSCTPRRPFRLRQPPRRNVSPIPTGRRRLQRFRADSFRAERVAACFPRHGWGFSDLGTGFNESFFVPLDFRGNHSVHGRAPIMENTGRRSNDSALARLGIFQFDLFKLFPPDILRISVL